MNSSMFHSVTILSQILPPDTHSSHWSLPTVFIFKDKSTSVTFTEDFCDTVHCKDVNILRQELQVKQGVSAWNREGYLGIIASKLRQWEITVMFVLVMFRTAFATLGSLVTLPFLAEVLGFSCGWPRGWTAEAGEQVHTAPGACCQVQTILDWWGKPWVRLWGLDFFLPFFLSELPQGT